MEIEIVSKDCIKPSSQTPSHLKTYNISLLDQIVPPCYYSMILLYNNQETQISERSLLLKQSLSETLSRFYPLAGRMKDNLSIDCNDEGVYYVEAIANISMSEYLNQCDIYSLDKLLPEASGPILTPESCLAMIQETKFVCGGFTIGFLVSHTVCDGTALSSFLKEWAAAACKSNKEIKKQREKKEWAATTCKSNKKLLHPYLDSSSIFLQHAPSLKEEATAMGLCYPFLKKKKINTRRFLFNASAITNLKDKAISSGVTNPTRVEVVTAMFIKCLVPSFKALAMTHAVNLRKRAVPPIPECSMGNFVFQAATLYKTKETELCKTEETELFKTEETELCKTEETELSSIVLQLREATAKINGDFVKKLQSDGGYLRLYEIFKESSGVLIGSSSVPECVLFSSWCNFGLYDTDFGWGQPVWTASAVPSNLSETLFANLIMFMDAREEKGIEAWVTLDEQDMLLLEKDEELLKYVCIDPIP